MDLDKVTSDDDLKEKIRGQLQKKGLSWNELNSKQQTQIVKGAKVAKKTVKKTMT